MTPISCEPSSERVLPVGRPSTCILANPVYIAQINCQFPLALHELHRCPWRDEMTTRKLWLTLCTSGFLFATLTAAHAQLPPPPAPAAGIPAPAPSIAPATPAPGSPAPIASPSD